MGRAAGARPKGGRSAPAQLEREHDEQDAGDQEHAEERRQPVHPPCGTRLEGGPLVLSGSLPGLFHQPPYTSSTARGPVGRPALPLGPRSQNAGTVAAVPKGGRTLAQPLRTANRTALRQERRAGEARSSAWSA